jgi:Ca2+-binding RTX toxin-like protein
VYGGIVGVGDRHLFKLYLAYASSLLMLTIAGITIPIQNLGWAAPIECPPAKSNCAGTSGDDIIIGSSKNNFIIGHDGNDVINATDGDDEVCGGNGNDKIDGGEGDDRLIGDSFVCKGEQGPGTGTGTDTITGGLGNDILIHGNGNIQYDYYDGKKDFLDCGPGDDTAMLNITIDHDEAANCEHINPE